MPGLIVRWRLAAVSLAVGAIGGSVFAWLHAPLPWMLGPIFAIAVCNLRGAGLTVPGSVRRGGQWIVGCVLGLYFTAEAVGRMLSLGPALALATLLSVLLGLVFAWALMRFGKADAPTAFFGGAIGGASEMLVQGERNGASTQLIAAGHTLRLIIVITVIPFGLAAFGIRGDEAWTPTLQQPFDLQGAALLVLVTGLAALIAQRLDVPNSWVLGPLFAAALLAYFGAPVGAMPRIVINLGQLLLGVAIGSRFAPDFFRVAPRYLSVMALSALVGIAGALLLAWGLSLYSSIRVPTLLLAVAPGGVAEMALTAKVLQLGVPVVTAFQVMRVVAVLMTVGSLYRALARRFGWRTGKQTGKQSGHR